MHLLKKKFFFLVLDHNSTRRLKLLKVLQQWFPNAYIKGVARQSRILDTIKKNNYDILFLPCDRGVEACEKLLSDIKNFASNLPVVIFVDEKVDKNIIALLTKGAYGVIRVSELSNNYPLSVILTTLQRKDYQEQVIKIQQSLKELTIKDEVTGIYNHRFLRECLEREFQNAQRYGHEMSVFMLDVDDFKEVNDKYGHLVGDFVLYELGQLLTRITRKSDVIARYGGEEFSAILPNTSLKDAYHLGVRICKTVARYKFKHEKAVIQLTMSIGATSSAYPRIRKALDLLRFADRALYTAKRSGKNTISVYPPLKEVHSPTTLVLI
ncbi:GGDEF domain-containing protein, partial [Candidatus Sumerlaeota bacterium]|nr:GGDEF domain-containing protein [Candidatus Sumerlaeota bacterium]